MSYGKWTLAALQVFSGTGYFHSWCSVHFYQPLEAKSPGYHQSQQYLSRRPPPPNVRPHLTFRFNKDNLQECVLIGFSDEIIF
jgi:hypothetical protein